MFITKSTSRIVSPLLTASVLLSVTAQAILISDSASAAPVSVPNAPSPTPPSPSRSVDDYEDNVPFLAFVSPDGQPILADYATRSPAYCSRLFVARVGKSYAEQYRFWNQCIRGRPIAHQ